MSEPVLLTEDQGPTRILTLNRPARRNALNTELTTALHDGLLAADDADHVRTIVLAGSGPAFCAGADLTEFADLTPDHPAAVLHRADLTMRTQALLPRLRKPIVSAVQGAAVGGGAGLALGCDMLIAGTDLRLGYPEVRHSIVPALVMTGLQRHAGRKLAFELVSTGRFLGADEALAAGLANRVVPPQDVRDTALAVAAGWAQVRPETLTTIKSLFNRIADLPYDEAMRAGRDVNALMRSFREAP